MQDSNIPIEDEDEALPFEVNEQATDLLHELLGFTADTARTNPNLAKAKLEERWAGMKQFIERVTSDDETEVEAAREQMRGLRATFEKHGVETNEQMEGLPDKINARYHADHAEQNERIANGLQQLADVIAQAGQTFSQALQKEADRLKDEEE